MELKDINFFKVQEGVDEGQVGWRERRAWFNLCSSSLPLSFPDPTGKWADGIQMGDRTFTRPSLPLVTGRLKSGSKGFRCYAGEVRLILEPIGLTVISLGFGKTALVMEGRLDCHKEGQVEPTEESGVCGTGPCDRWWGTINGSGSDDEDHRTWSCKEEGECQYHSPLAPAPAPQESTRSLFSYHLPEIITSHQSSGAMVLLQLYTHTCVTSSVQLREKTENIKDSTTGVGPNWGPSSAQLLRYLHYDRYRVPNRSHLPGLNYSML